MKIQINREKKSIAMSIISYLGITLFTTIPRLKMILFIVTRGRKRKGWQQKNNI